MGATAHPRRLGVAMIGYAFMGQAHSQGWRNARSFFDPEVVPELRVVCGRNAEAAQDLARRFGWESVETDWRVAIARDDVDIVDICTPGDTHAEIALAALAAGKHVLCEKPLANSVTEAVTMADAAEQARAAGTRSMVGFTYRRQAHEALIHRLDAEQTSGAVTPLDPVLAADGVLECLDVQFGGTPPWGEFHPLPHHVRVDCTDTGDQVWVQIGRFVGTSPTDGTRWRRTSRCSQGTTPMNTSPTRMVTTPSTVVMVSRYS